MSFSPFNHYYALFAALTSALAGIPEIRKRVNEIIEKSFKRMKDGINSHLPRASSLITQYKDILANCIETENTNHGTRFFKKYERRLKKIARFKAIEKSLNIDDELQIVSKRLTSLHVFIFLFCVNVLLVAAFVEAKVLDETFSFKFIGNFEWLCGFPVFYFCFFLKKDLGISCLMFALYLFAGTFIAALCLSVFSEGALNINTLTVIIFSLLISASPLIWIIYHAYIKWATYETHMRNRLKKEDREMDEETNLILAHYNLPKRQSQ